MKIEKFVTGIISTNCYLVSNVETHQAVIVDPAAVPKALTEAVERDGLTVEAVLLTHGHFDHTMGLDALLKLWDVPVYVEEEDQEILTDPKLNLSSAYTAGFTFSDAQSVEDGQILSLAGFQFQVLHTPGHTRGGCCYYAASEQVLFSGDTLFQASVGRTDFPNSSTLDLLRSIREKLLPLPDETVVYPGHMGETTIGYERDHNPYL
ncbi:MBL fold metallo-hydrolase [Lachnospiraceae bacterium KGMB03038]|nr:MBL fold metallo-hydrolase [Lachnospiraceae bacterium KGMB03038]